MNEIELIEQLKQNDDAAAKVVTKMFLKQLTAFACRQIDSKIEAEELVYKVFGELWETIYKKKVDFKDINGLRTFLYIKTANRITEYLRSNLYK